MGESSLYSRVDGVPKSLVALARVLVCLFTIDICGLITVVETLVCGVGVWKVECASASSNRRLFCTIPDFDRVARCEAMLPSDDYLHRCEPYH